MTTDKNFYSSFSQMLCIRYKKIVPFVLDVFIDSSSNDDSSNGIVPAHEEHQRKTLTYTK